MNKYQPSEFFRKPPFLKDKPTLEAMIQEGKSDSQIAAQFNVAKDTIRCRRIVWGLSKSGSATKEELLKENIERLWKEGYSVIETADLLGLSEQAIYKKMRQYSVRSIPRMGLEAPTLSLTELRHSFTKNGLDEDQVVLVTHNRTPKWALVPIDQYQDLTTGVFSELREESK